MRKKAILLLSAMLLCVSQMANAQVRFGLKGGLNITDMSFDNEFFDASNRLGYFGGATVKVSLPVPFLAVDVAALYSQLDSKVNGLSITQKCVLVPANLRLQLGGSSAGVYLAAGPQVSFNVGDDEYKWNELDTYKLKNSNFSVNLGGGIMLGKLEVGVAYNIACGKTADASLRSVINGVSDEVKSKSHANYWQLSATYFF